MPTFAILGAGGAGGYFGARLVEAGHDVAFVARGAHLAAIRARGLAVTSPEGDLVARPRIATDDARAVGPVDHVIVGVKAWQLAALGPALAPLVGDATTVLPLQNGVEAADQLAAIAGRARVLGGVAKILSFVRAPGELHHVGVRPVLELGELDGAASARVDELAGVFGAARGVTVVAAPDIVARLWSKLVFIAGWGGVGAVLRAPVGAIRELPETRRLVEGAMQEIAAVARARGCALPDDAVGSALRLVDSLPAEGTASLQRDLADGRPSELDQLTGAVVRLGSELGLATPINRLLYQALAPLERRARA